LGEGTGDHARHQAEGWDPGVKSGNSRGITHLLSWMNTK
jgi:hypothetical protein